MQHLIQSFDVGAWLQANTKSRHLVTREVGKICRDAIEQQLHTIATGSVTTLDCRSVEHVDFTGADECLVKLIQRMIAMEYGDIYLVLAGLTPTQEENLVVALQRKNLATLVQRKDGLDVIGYLSPYLYSAYLFLIAEKSATARELCDASENGDLSLASTKFLNLHKARLIQRTGQRIPAGGHQFLYSLVVDVLPRLKSGDSRES
jgi:hypothetical protein